MSETTLTIIASNLFLVGVFYGVTNIRLKNLENRLSETSDQSERLARLEEKINLLLKHFIK